MTVSRRRKFFYSACFLGAMSVTLATINPAIPAPVIGFSVVALAFIAVWMVLDRVLYAWLGVWASRVLTACAIFWAIVLFGAIGGPSAAGAAVALTLVLAAI